VPECTACNPLRQNQVDIVLPVPSRLRAIRLRMTVGARGRNIQRPFDDTAHMVSRLLPIEALRDDQAATGNRQ
jgi:hypothetical protein